MVISITKLDSCCGAYRGASRPVAFSASMCAQVTFNGMVLFCIIANSAIGTGGSAFTASCASIFINLNDTCFKVLAYGFWADRTGAKTGRPFALLASDGEKIKQGGAKGVCVTCVITIPHNTVAIGMRSKRI